MEATSKRIIIADGGSTKCQWLLSDGKNILAEAETEGCNPVLLTEEEIKLTWREPLQKSSMGMHMDDGVDCVYYYGAGCVGGEASQRMADALARLTGCERAEVASDMLGAARATMGSRRGVVCILGTGANSCAYDGEHLTANIPPLGYILGDEGSGADIGKHVVADALRGFLPDDLTEKFYAFAGTDYQGMIEAIYRKPMANAYLARFAKFARQNIENEEIRQIVNARLEAFLDRNVLHYDKQIVEGGVSFVGGVAEAFEKELRNVCERKGVKVLEIMERPMEGLVKYHTGK